MAKLRPQLYERLGAFVEVLPFDDSGALVLEIDTPKTGRGAVVLLKDEAIELARALLNMALGD